MEIDENLKSLGLEYDGSVLNKLAQLYPEMISYFDIGQRVADTNTVPVVDSFSIENWGE